MTKTKEEMVLNNVEDNDMFNIYEVIDKDKKKLKLLVLIPKEMK